MNAPVNAAFASILGNICPPAPSQPMVEGEYLCTVSYEGLMVDVYTDDGCFSGIAVMGGKVHIGGVMLPAAIRQIEIDANAQMVRA